MDKTFNVREFFNEFWKKHSEGAMLAGAAIGVLVALGIVGGIFVAIFPCRVLPIVWAWCGVVIAIAAIKGISDDPVLAIGVLIGAILSILLWQQIAGPVEVSTATYTATVAEVHYSNSGESGEDVFVLLDNGERFRAVVSSNNAFLQAGDEVIVSYTVRESARWGTTEGLKTFAEK